MTIALRRMPKLVHPMRYARNGFIPEAVFAGKIVGAQNHVMAFRRKSFLAASALDTTSKAGAAAETVVYRFRCHVGYGATHIGFVVGMGRSSAKAATDPIVRIKATIAGGATTTLDLHGVAGSFDSVTDAPSEIAWREGRIAVTANTTYEVLASTVDYARIVSIASFEIASDVVSSATNYYADIATPIGYPINDATRQTMLVGLSNLWRRNGSHLLTWPGAGPGVAGTGPGGTGAAGNPTYGSTTWTNVIDAATTVSASTAGYYLGDGDETLEALARQSDVSGGVSSIDVVLAVHCSVTGSATGEVRLQDAGGTLASITGMGTGSAWYTATTTLDAGAMDKCDLQARTSNASNTMTLNAVSVYTLA